MPTIASLMLKRTCNPACWGFSETVPEGTAKPLAAPDEKLMLLTDGVLDEELLLLLELGGGDDEDDGGTHWEVEEGFSEVEGGTHVEEVDGGSHLGVEVSAGCQVEVALGGVHWEVVGSPPPPLPSLNHHSPVRTPRDSGPKNRKSPMERSRPPQGQPGHSSMILAEVVFPP